MKLLLAVILLAAAIACTPASPVAFVGADGKPAYKIECLDDEKNCDQQARELCPGGYAVSSNRPHIVAIWRGVDVVNRIRFVLTIECE